MEELYSNAVDCQNLACMLYQSLGKKFDLYGSWSNPLASGKYYTNGKKNPVSFYYKYCKDGFLRINIGNYFGSNNSLGQKLAALSDFYEVLSKEFGEPIVFYTLKNDKDGLLSLHWSFGDKLDVNNDIVKFQTGTYFDDAVIDKLIVLGQFKGQTNEKTKEIVARKVGLPFELISLVDEDIENYVLHKKGVEMKIAEDAKVDGYPVTSYEKIIYKK